LRLLEQLLLKALSRICPGLNRGLRKLLARTPPGTEKSTRGG
jgi:hypothetical protein